MAEQEKWVRVRSESELAPGMVAKTVGCGTCGAAEHVYIISRRVDGGGPCPIAETCGHGWVRVPRPPCSTAPLLCVAHLLIPEGRLYRLDVGLDATDEADRIRRCDADDARRARKREGVR